VKRYAIVALVGFLVGAVLSALSAQALAVWTVESVGYKTTNGVRSHRRLVLIAPLTTPVPKPGQQFTLAPYTPPTPPCAFTVTPTSGSVSADGGPVSVQVTASAATCASAATSAAAWLTASPTTLVGSGTVVLTASANPDTTPRDGTVTIAGTTVTVGQAAKVQPPVLIWGVVDATTLGTCTDPIHDTFTVDGGDGWRYRTWHPQTVALPNGGTCTFAHEHGDDPARMTNAEIAASPVRFGFIGRRHPMPGEPAGHEEPHEGFKVFIALPGDVNDEGRVNRVFSRSVFHMGTGGPRRFVTQHHSAEIRLVHPEFGLKAFTQLMMDTGGVDQVCPQRADAPTKDVVMLVQRCTLNSFYEIWGTFQDVRRVDGSTVYRAFATPAVFDPITVFNPANPGELVYAWDRRVDAVLNFPGNSRTHHRGCDRESYAQPGYWYNRTGVTTYWTDAMGQAVARDAATALRQEISLSDSVGAPATNDGLKQFKMRRDYCGVRSALGLKN
jgi:hypothetical protein